MHNHAQGVVLDVGGLHLVGGLKNGQDVLISHIVFQVLLAECLEPVVGEAWKWS